MWTWRVPIKGELPAELTAAVVKPYLEIFRPHLVRSRHVQVRKTTKWCTATLAHVKRPRLATPASFSARNTLHRRRCL